MFGRILQWSHLVLTFVFRGVPPPPISCLVVCQIIYSWLSFGRLYVSRNLSVLSCPICLYITDYTILFWVLYIYGIICYFFSLISYFVYLSPLSFFFLMSLAKCIELRLSFKEKKIALSFIEYPLPLLLFFWSLCCLFPLWSL